jgi:hypothetical protein
MQMKELCKFENGKRKLIPEFEHAKTFFTQEKLDNPILLNKHFLLYVINEAYTNCYI